jgi:RNA-directed DNA polymerase
MKPANKAGQPAAEWAEQRAGTKGNTGQPHTRRTQSRESVSQGLDRVRHAARQRKKDKFTALLHHVTIDRLRDAFLALKRRAAPGVDGVTWEDHEEDWRSTFRTCTLAAGKDREQTDSSYRCSRSCTKSTSI